MCGVGLVWLAGPFRRVYKLRADTEDLAAEWVVQVKAAVRLERGSDDGNDSSRFSAPLVSVSLLFFALLFLSVCLSCLLSLTGTVSSDLCRCRV